MRLFHICYGPDEGSGGGDTGAPAAVSEQGPSSGDAGGGTPSSAEMAAEFSSDSGVSPNAETGQTGETGTAVADQPTGTPAEPSAKEQRRTARAAERQAAIEAQRELIETLREMRKPPAPVKQAPTAPVWDAAKYAKLQATDPEAALDMVLEHRLLSNPKIADRLLGERLQPVEQVRKQMAEQEHMSRMQTNHTMTAQKYPEFKPGNPLHDMTISYVESNPWVAQAAQALPNVNMVEVAYRLATYDNMVQQLAAYKSKVVDKRAVAATVKTGTGGKVAPRSGNIARQAAQDLADKGTTVPQAWADQMEAALARHS